MIGKTTTTTGDLMKPRDSHATPVGVPKQALLGTTMYNLPSRLVQSAYEPGRVRFYCDFCHQQCPRIELCTGACASRRTFGRSGVVWRLPWTMKSGSVILARRPSSLLEAYMVHWDECVNAFNVPMKFRLVWCLNNISYIHNVSRG